MKFFKKSLGQNFLIEKNIVKKILNLCEVKGKNILEIGPGKGFLTNEIIKKDPKSISLIEKDNELCNYLKIIYSKKKINIFNEDVLKFNLKKIKGNKITLFGNLPYNISSQILIKIIKEKNLDKRFENIIFMFQKELGNKIIGKFRSKNYGRLSIITHFKLKIVQYFLVSSNCFFPKPKVESMVIHFKTLKRNNFKIKKISNLEKVTNIIFSNKRKMINKSVKKILSDKDLRSIPKINLKLRPENIDPNIFYKITELYEKKLLKDDL